MFNVAVMPLTVWLLLLLAEFEYFYIDISIVVYYRCPSFFHLSLFNVTACMYICDSTLNSLFLLPLFAEGNDIKNVSHVKRRPRPQLHAYTMYANTCYNMSELLMYGTVMHIKGR